MKYKVNIFLMFIAVFMAGCIHHVKQDDNTIFMGVRADVPLVAYYNLKGERAGSEIDLANNIADALGKRVEFITVTSANRKDMLLSGKVDMVIATFSITDDRKKHFLFSTSYKTEHQGIMVHHRSQVTQISDLANKRIGVIRGSDSLERVSQKIPSATIVPFDNYYRAMIALNMEDIDAISTDKSILQGLRVLWKSPKQLKKIDGTLTFLVDVKATDNGIDFRILDSDLSTEKYGIAMRHEDGSLIKKVDFFLTHH